ncbi:MAG: hypothetical protein ACLQBX_07910 [Candidatus Limnocylindrales bacterium]
MEMEDGSLWAAVVVDTMDDAKATVDRVARGVEDRRSHVGGQLDGGRARLTWWASRAARRLLPHRHAPRRVVIWHPGPGGARRVETHSAYCRCGVRVTVDETDVA